MASAGAVVNLDGALAASPQPRILAIGLRLYFFRADSETSRTAEAPSERGEALGAVTVPVLSLIKAGPIDLSFSWLSCEIAVS